MKTLSIFAVLIAAFSVTAQETKKELPDKIPSIEATNYYNKTLTVTGKVVQVTIREKLVYLNLDKPFPASPFTAVIFAKNTNQFGDLDSLKGKDVEVKGKIEEYKEKPQIILNSTNQLKVISKEEKK